MPVDLNDAEVIAAIAAEARKVADAETEGLKKKRDELLGENKTLKELKAKYDGIDPDKARELLEKLKKEGEEGSSAEELRGKIEGEFAPKLTAAEKKAADAEAKLNARIIDGDLTSALVEANVAKDFLPAAKALLKEGQKIEVTESGATVDGKPLSAFVKEWIEKDGKHFVAADDNSGGGGSGNGKGGAPANQKRGTMTVKQKNEFIAAHGSEAYLALPQN